MILAYRREAFGCRLVHLMCSCFVGLILLAAPPASHAEGTVSPIYNASAPPLVKHAGEFQSHLFDTPDAACTDCISYQAVDLGWKGWIYDHVETRNENQISCFAKDPATGTVAWYSIIPIMRSCDGIGWVNYPMTCAKNVCPANSTGTPAANPTTCTCNEGYEPDSVGTNCVPVTPCPVTALTPLPANDACAQALENIGTTQAQKDAACGTLTTAMQSGKSCLESKLANLGTPIPLAVTADIRNITYQAHLREIWDKMERLVELVEEYPAMETACATRRAEIAAEKGCDNAGPCVGACSQAGRNHCLRGRPARPSQNDAQHTQGNAIDVSSSSTITPLLDYLRAINPPQQVQQFLDSPPNCNLNWGGTFTDNPDLVHFYVR